MIALELWLELRVHIRLHTAIPDLSIPKGPKLQYGFPHTKNSLTNK